MALQPARTIGASLEATERSIVEFRVLGPVEALRGGKPLPLGGPRQQALLALLLLDAGRPVSADRLIDGLWVGEPPDGAEISLRSYVSRLRSALGEGEARYLLGDDEAAGEFFEAARAAYSEIGWRAHVGHALRGLAGVAARQGRHEAAAGLLGRAEAVMGSLGASEGDFAPAIAREAEAIARTALGDRGFTDAFDDGQREEALAP